MTVSMLAETIEGYVLAATVADDANGARASAALSPVLHAEVARLVQRLDALPTDVRRSELRKLAGRMRLRADVRANVPARARALLLGDFSPDPNRQDLEPLPHARRGFAPPADMRSALRRIAKRCTGASPETEEKERNLGMRALAVAHDVMEVSAWNVLLQRLDAAEADRVRNMRSSLDEPKKEVALTLEALARLVVAAESVLQPPFAEHDSLPERQSFTRVLGALVFGFQGRMNGDEASEGWRRAGADLRMLEDASCLG